MAEQAMNRQASVRGAVIRTAHGSGGKETEDLVKKVFLKHFDNEGLRGMEDAAIVEMRGRSAFTTDSYVVTPLFFRGGDIGRLSVCGTVNDLLMMGAHPRYLTAGFILEEGLPLDTLESVVISMAETAREAGIAIVAGDTKVIGGKGGMMITTAGIGEIPPGREAHARHCLPGDAILVSGNLGDHHACILSARMGIENRISSDAAPLNTLVEALFENGIRVRAMRDVTRGGLATILHEICEASGTGALLQEAAIPVGGETAAFCEILGLDPLVMGNEGRFVAIVDGEDADKAAGVLRAIRNGENAVVIGRLRGEKGIALLTRLGGKRNVGPLYGEGLPRIC
jgi:hydrogenase expression/formation protein HypE